MSRVVAGNAQALASKGQQASRGSAYRPEIQGLRSLAVLMVVTYHVWFGRVSGGVDVFLLISAFLMTLQFTGRHQRREPLALVAHWLNLFRRLLPASVTVIVATLAASYLFLPRNRWLDVIQHGWASLFYWENRLLQEQAVNYYANNHGLASPLQHYWSLSIQGQVFILWPVIFVLAAWAAAWLKLAYRPLLACIFAVIFAGSLAYSTDFTASNQAQSYFDTGARLWEFALGTLVALLLPGLRLPRRARILMGWVGLAAMLTCGIFLNVGAAFPGTAALWPTLAAALVIAAGQTNSAAGVDRLLSSGPLVKLGSLSYALYLWHWPVLVIALAWSGKEHAGWLSGSAIILASLILAQLTTRMIDKPWREWKWLDAKRHRTALAVILAVAVAGAPLLFWRHHILQGSTIASIGLDDPRYPGALALSADYEPTQHDRFQPVPKLEVIAEEWPVFPEQCIGAGENASICTNGVEGGTRHIVVMGNSHSFVLNTPILMLAEKRNWRVTSITKGFCPLTNEPGPGITEDCLEFNWQGMELVRDLKPDVVVTTSTRTDADPDIPDVLEDAWINAATKLNEAGIPVIGVRDTPRMPQHVPACLEENRQETGPCNGSHAENFRPVPATEEVDAHLPDTRFLDFTRYFCSDGICPAVIGNVIVYKDEHHVTRSFLMTLAPFFEQEFLAVTGWEG